MISRLMIPESAGSTSRPGLRLVMRVSLLPQTKITVRSGYENFEYGSHSSSPEPTGASNTLSHSFAYSFIQVHRASAPCELLCHVRHVKVT